MPVYPCHHHACTEHVARRGDVCALHARTTRTARQAVQHHYDQHHRDQESKAFYNSKAWKLARADKLATCPFCERCRREWAEHVHHRLPLKRCTPPEKTAQPNLMSLCPGCHTTVESTPAERDAITAAYLATTYRKAAPCSS